MLLGQLSERELSTQANAGDFPKWNSLCRLRWLGAETLDAVLVTPAMSASSESALSECLAMLTCRIGKERLMIRTDAMYEPPNYVRGGNTFDLDDAISFANTVLADGRAVIALEPTNRFANRATANIGVDRDGTWRCEILGPGYDASDLQRNGAPPEYICTGMPFSETTFSTVSEVALRIQPQDIISMDTRIEARLDSIIRHMFPAMGIVPPDPARQFCRSWLAERGDTTLFRMKLFPFPFHVFRRAFETAQLAYHYFSSRNARVEFVLSSSVLDDGRQVFWDITDSQSKWTVR